MESAWLRAWNLFGIADLIVAVATGFLSSPSRLQMFAFAAPDGLIGAFPLAMIPVFLVPLSILLHLASFKKLQQTQTGWQIDDPLLVGTGANCRSFRPTRIEQERALRSHEMLTSQVPGVQSPGHRSPSV